MNAIIVSALLGVVMMFSGIIVKNRSYHTVIAAGGLLLLLLANLLNSYGIWVIKVDTHNMFNFEQFGMYFNTIAIAATLIYVLLSGKAVEKIGSYSADYYALIFFVLCGVSILSAFNSLLILFLGIEILTIPLYILTGADKRNLKSNEASLKYFLMGCFSTGIMLMGVTLIYGGTGSFILGESKVPESALMPKTSFLEIAGMILLFVSMCFKVSAAPFHFWTPDVYDGAPGVFTSFMATIVKAAGFIAFVRLFDQHTELLGPSWKILLSFVIIATLLVGNITAVFQQSVKRMLAYSSIAQAGFMLFSLYGANDLAREGILLYSVAYSLATIGIFAVLIKMKDYTFEGFNGLAKTQPVLALSTAICLLSLAGIPLTAGFFAKYYMLASAVKAGGSLWLVVIAVLFAAVSVYYYFRVIQAMYFKDGEPETEEITGPFKLGLLVVAALVILVGIFPSLVLNWFYF
ncbi:MAG: NADH-quinone oxidoreductase subunit N [Chitinophagaceae bacterium]|nr:NADH-quinone oxidoreductase subunit N [Chitinophagaceae bacterium]MEA3425919.1 NADH-quinone oxidoreductase subunit N [Bacteroidota bacterium]MCA6451683.1 NADH-quinone oxidoreductase subunit N [Chitinophagaceae bacterium]MCA6456054.1 NADH-quinone oxidoreductase subunit N [Chitinophagaceae bacterium]MCA6459788.1 NADH-quinone oxidoreductase subunit N [Chitinophagaceae bacterium]